MKSELEPDVNQVYGIANRLVLLNHSIKIPVVTVRLYRNVPNDLP